MRKARVDARQGSDLLEWVHRAVLGGFAGRILPLDGAVAVRAASLHVPDPRPDLGAFIAATALVRGLTVVTRNVRDFEPMGVPVFNPWSER